MTRGPRQRARRCSPSVSRRDAPPSSPSSGSRPMNAEPLTTPRSCAFCNWNGDIGAQAHATLIHPDRAWLVMEQFGHEFVLDATAGILTEYQRGYIDGNASIAASLGVERERTAG